MSKRRNKLTESARRREARCAKWDAEDREAAKRELALAGMTPAQIRRAMRSFDRTYTPNAQRPRAWGCY